jgi:hypothetical protein
MWIRGYEIHDTILLVIRSEDKITHIIMLPVLSFPRPVLLQSLSLKSSGHLNFATSRVRCASISER